MLKLLERLFYFSCSPSLVFFFLCDPVKNGSRGRKRGKEASSTLHQDSLSIEVKKKKKRRWHSYKEWWASVFASESLSRVKKKKFKLNFPASHIDIPLAIQTSTDTGALTVQCWLELSYLGLKRLVHLISTLSGNDEMPLCCWPI